MKYQDRLLSAEKGREVHRSVNEELPEAVLQFYQTLLTLKLITKNDGE